MVNSKTSAMSKEVKLVKVTKLSKEKDENSGIRSKKTGRTSPHYVLKRSIDVVRGRGVTDKTAQGVLFVGKVVVLDALRRIGRTNLHHFHRPLVWTLQGLAGLNGLTAIQAAPVIWLQRWAPFRILAHVTEGIANPIIFLSLAGVVTTAFKRKVSVNPDSQHHELLPKDVTQETGVPVPNTFPAVNIAFSDPTAAGAISERQELTAEFWREDLEKTGVILPEWFDDDAVQRVWVAAHGDKTKFVANLKNTIQWRENYHFLSQSDLEAWEHLLFWHKQDSLGRPALIIRLGLAFSTLAPLQRTLFVQAIVSQVEYGLRNKVPKDDARLTVVMDCQGTSAIGFPLNMMKSCSMLVQEHYPTRLAALFVINLPPVVQVLANAVLQVVKPSTRKKVYMEGDKYMNRMATYLGGIFDVPIVLGGRCSCDYCKDATDPEAKGKLKAQKELGQDRDRNLTLDERARCLRQSTYESYSGTLLVVITSLFILWIVGAVISEYGQPRMLPT